MAEPDRTNADAERVSDIVKPVAWQCEFFRADPSPRWVREIWFDDPRDTYGPTLVRNVHALVPADIIEAQSKALAEARVTTVFDHKWFDPACHADGCRSLILEAALAKLAFMAMTSGGTVGPDPELQKAISEATALLPPRATPTPENPNG